MECPLYKCLAGHTLVRREGECCPTCSLNCLVVLCAFIQCEKGFSPVVPEGQCCPRCVPDDVPDCSTILCQRPLCKKGEELVVPEGECCPQCQPADPPVCRVKGQIFTDCASPCPRTCDSNPQLRCPAVCVPGCACPSGQVIDSASNRCVPPDECPSKLLYYIARCIDACCSLWVKSLTMA